MKGNALGFIEAVGLPVAIAAADAAIKAANVSLIGYEKTKGSGLIVVKLAGDVGAVKAAVEAGVMAGQQAGKIYAHHVIPRPHEGTGSLADQVDRGPRHEPPAPVEQPVEKEPARAVKHARPDGRKAKPKPNGKKSVEEEPVLSALVEAVAVAPEPPLEAGSNGEIAEAEFETHPEEALAEPEIEAPPETQIEVAEASQAEEPVPAPTTEATTAEICNLCGDPECPRRKGQPHKWCSHYAASPAEAGSDQAA